MQKLKQKFKLYLLVVAMCVGFVQNAAALTPEENFYVNDYIGILSAEHKDAMISRAGRLQEENGVQVVTVITDYVIGESIASYGVNLFNEFGIGSEGDHNGLLLLLALEDGEVEIVTGDGMEGILTDSAAGRLLDDYFMPHAETGDFDNAIYDTYMQLIAYGAKAETQGGAAVAPATGSSAAESSYGQAEAGTVGRAFNSLFRTIMTIMIILIVVMVIFMLVRPRGRRHYGPTYPQQPYYPPPRRRRSSMGSFFTGMMVGSSMNRHRRNPPPPNGGPGGGKPSGGNLFGGSSGGGGRTSGGGASRSFGASSAPRSRPTGGRTTGGGGRTSGGGASRSFKK